MTTSPLLAFFRRAYEEAINDLERMSNIIQDLEAEVKEARSEIEAKDEEIVKEGERCERLVRAAEGRAADNEIDAKAYRERGFYQLAEELDKAKARLIELEDKLHDADAEAKANEEMIKKQDQEFSARMMRDELLLERIVKLANNMGLKNPNEGPALTYEDALAFISDAVQQHAPWSGKDVCGKEKQLKHLLTRCAPFITSPSFFQEIAKAVK